MVTITGEFIQLGDEYLKTTSTYLRSRGISYDSGLDGMVFFIEVSEEPDILFCLRASGYIGTVNAMFEIIQISEYGISFFIIEQHIGCGGEVFLPHSNIISLHTVSPAFLSELRKRKENV